MKKVFLLGIIFCAVFAAEELTLEDSIKYAMDHSPKVLSAKEKAAAARGGLTAAASLLWPQVSAIGTVTRSSALTRYDYSAAPLQLPVFGANGIPTGAYIPFAMPNVASDRVGDIYMAKLSLAWPVFTWGKINGFVEIAEANKNIADEELEKTAQDVNFDVKSGFYSLLMSQQLVKVLEETKKSLQGHVDVVTKRYESGLASKFELLRAKVQLSNIDPQLNRAVNGYELALMGFNNTLGAESNNKYTAKGEFKYEKEIFDLEKCQAGAVEKRLEIKEMEERIKQAVSALNIAAAGCRPSITLTADYSTNMGALMPPEDTSWSTGWDAGAVISIPVFDAFSTSGKYEEAEGNLKQAKIGKQQLLDGIAIEVKGAYLTLVANEKTILAQADNVDMAKESLNMVRERYAQGLSTNLDVLDTEISLLQTEISYYQSLYDYILAKEKLIKAAGMIGGENVKK